jgi:hypothetical protein
MPNGVILAGMSKSSKQAVEIGLPGRDASTSKKPSVYAGPYGFLTAPYGSPYGSDLIKPNVYAGPYGFTGEKGGWVWG